MRSIWHSRLQRPCFQECFARVWFSTDPQESAQWHAKAPRMRHHAQSKRRYLLLVGMIPTGGRGAKTKTTNSRCTKNRGTHSFPEQTHDQTTLAINIASCFNYSFLVSRHRFWQQNFFRNRATTRGERTKLIICVGLQTYKSVKHCCLLDLKNAHMQMLVCFATRSKRPGLRIMPCFTKRNHFS